MTRLPICPLLLAIYPLLLAQSIQHGEVTQAPVLLEALPSDVGDVTCTGNLQCESSNGLCMPGELYAADHPVLVPTDIRSKTVKKCNERGCSLCLQLVMDISVAFISEDAKELGSGGCDYENYYDYDYEEEEEEEEEGTTTLNPNLSPTNSINDSYLCADIYISQPTPMLACYQVKVSLPQNLVPRRPNTGSVRVGSLVYNCINAPAGNNMTLTVFTYPRYFEVKILSHEIPQCNELDPEEEVTQCEVPVMKLFVSKHNVSIGLTNKTLDKNVSLYRYWNSSSRAHQITVPLGRRERYTFPKSEIVPCLCFSVYYDSPLDARRASLCPFLEYPEEITLNRSRLLVEAHGNNLNYTLSAPCNVTAELSLCWRSSDLTACTEFPHSRQQINSETMDTVKLEQLHPSVCLQVSVRGKVLHTNCPLFTGSHRARREEALVLVSRSHGNIASICQIEEKTCNVLYSSDTKVRAGAEFLEQMVVRDVMDEQCRQIWISDQGPSVYVCPLYKYVRSKWNWSRILSLLAVACVVLIVILNNKHLKNWIKSLTADKDLGDIFRDRRLLILYSPDSPEYEHLVRVFASSLKDLRLDVVLDQWHSVEISAVSPLPWYHRQKELISHNKGLILLLFSEGARERYDAWREQKLGGLTDYAFGAVLSCVHSDFEDKTARGRYIIGAFNFYGQNVVPELFRSVPAYSLPANLPKLLQEIAGDGAQKFSRNQVTRLAAVISDNLRPPITECQNSRGQSSGSTSGSTVSDNCVAVELQPLV